MMDIVDRLRNRIHDSHMDTERMIDDAADEIERLTRELAAVTKAADEQAQTLHDTICSANRLSEQLAAVKAERDEYNTARLGLIDSLDKMWDERHTAQQERDHWKEASQINERMRTELRQERDEYAKDVLRLVETIKYLCGIAERGTGNECPPDVTVEQFVLEYVKQLESLREKLAALEPVGWVVNYMGLTAEIYYDKERADRELERINSKWPDKFAKRSLVPLYTLERLK